MALYFRCPCTAILECPEGTGRGRTYCSSCGKVVVVPQDAIPLTPKEIEEAKSALAEALPDAAAAVPPGITEPVFQTPEPEAAAFPEAEEVTAEVTEPAAEERQLLLTSPVADQEAADLFDEAPAVGAGALAEALPDIPEIPDPIAAPQGAATPKEAVTQDTAVAQEVPAQAPPVEGPSGPPIVAGKKPAAPGAAAQRPKPGKRPSRVSSRRRGRRAETIACPACGEEIAADSKVCTNCGERLKKVGVLRRLVGLLILLTIVLAVGLVAAVRFIPEKLPPVVIEKVQMVGDKLGDKLKELGISVPEWLIPAGTGEEAAGAEEAAPSEAGAAPEPGAEAAEPAAAESEELSLEAPPEPEVVVDDGFAPIEPEEFMDDVIVE